MGDPRVLYGGPELAPLWRALWQRYSSGKAVTRVTLRGLDLSQRSALADLLGLDRTPPTETTVQVATLDEVLRSSVGMEARAVVTAIVGPLDNRTLRRESDRLARSELWNWLAEHEIVIGQPALEAWVAGVRRTGVVDGSVEKTREVLARALDVLAELPSDGRPLPAFAGTVCGDTHALDDGTRLSTLVLRALAAIHDEPPPEDAEQRRACWERAGIACDAMSTSVLVAGLRPVGTDPLSATLRQWAEHAEAAVITLAQIRRHGPLAVSTSCVRVVENPSILAMAIARLGSRCPPLIATSGWPNSACMLLMRQLTEAGVTLGYHGDFDGEGIRIAAHVMSRTGATAWRMSTRDYLTAVHPGRPDSGAITEAPWDPELASALRQHRSTVSEEHVAEQLLSDLDASG
ncbi:TIGR02679 family protein [Actinophytocola xanthii]|uniref:TIGR02679 family protein n=1 Tax=Actinophytocola xanthii TaxID=1912961 RepID=A0A1Q8BYV8_9PSEU|nr:TIGR02679 family protein [Actinophytocola xanthii]OLF07293.1 TIGR02679 family protein [Actinophytocola xanthii]OLF07461.1 TIGR02679 family protein [Actinophytocola xanthii]